MIDPKPRLLYAEDDAGLGPLVADGLAEEYEVVFVTTADDALRLLTTEPFDAAVLDRRLPGGDGAGLVDAARVRGVTTPVVLLTALGATAERVDGLDSGADDYLVKPFEFDELFARLRAIRRNRQPEGRRLAVGSLEFAPTTRTVYSPYEGAIVLTERESQVLRLLANRPEHVFSRDEILAAVFDEHDTPGTVDTYVHYLRRKVDPQVVVTVWGRGYRLGQP